MCGVGPVEAASATARHLALSPPDTVVHVGIAGARGIIPGGLVVGSGVGLLRHRGRDPGRRSRRARMPGCSARRCEARSRRARPPDRDECSGRRRKRRPRRRDGGIRRSARVCARRRAGGGDPRDLERDLGGRPLALANRARPRRARRRDPARSRSSRSVASSPMARHAKREERPLPPPLPRHSGRSASSSARRFARTARSSGQALGLGVPVVVANALVWKSPCGRSAARGAASDGAARLAELRGRRRSRAGHAAPEEADDHCLPRCGARLPAVPLLVAIYILPGLAWLALFGLAVPAALVENLGVRAALGRGIRLARADYIHVLGGLATLALVLIISQFTLYFVLREYAENTRLIARAHWRRWSYRRSSFSEAHSSTSTRRLGYGCARIDERSEMPTYLMLTTLTEKGVQTLHANPSRLAEVNRDVEEMGAKVAPPVGRARRVRLREHRRSARRHDHREGIGRAGRAWQREARVASVDPGRRVAAGVRDLEPLRPYSLPARRPVGAVTFEESARSMPTERAPSRGWTSRSAR